MSKKLLTLAISALATLGLFADAYTFTAGEDVPLGTASGSFAEYVATSGTGKMDSSAYHVGSTKAGFTMTVSLNNSTAGDYVLSMKGGNKSNASTIKLTVTGDDYSVEQEVTQPQTSAWDPSVYSYMVLKGLPSGSITLTMEITDNSGSTSYAGNYGYFRFTKLSDVAAILPYTDAINVGASYVSLTGCKKDSVDTTIGSTGDSTKFSFTFYVPETDKAAKYALSYAAGSAGYTANLNWTLTNLVTKTQVAPDSGVETHAIANSGSWNLTQEKTFDFGILEQGLYVATAYVSDRANDTGTGTYAGNYGNFVFSQTFCTVTAADVENATVSVTANGEAVTGDNGVYTVDWGADVVVTYTANSGYALIGDSVFTFEDIDDAQTVTAPTVNVTGSFTSGTDIEVATYDSDSSSSTAKNYVVLSGCSPDTYYKTNYIMGNSHVGDYFIICLNNETAGDYLFTWKGAASGFATTYKVTVSDGTKTYLEETYTQDNISSWMPKTQQKVLLTGLPTGAFTIRFDLLSTTGSYAGNYGYFNLTSVSDIADDAFDVVENSESYLNFNSNYFTTANCTVESDYVAGSTGSSTTFNMLLYVSEAGKYAFSYMHGASGVTCNMNWTLADLAGNTVWSGTNAMTNTSSWTPSVSHTNKFGTLSAGVYTLSATVSDQSGSTTYAGNYGYFRVYPLVYTVTVPDADNASVAATVNGEAADLVNGSMVVQEGDTVVVTYTAAEGYALSGTSTYTFENVSEAIEIETAPTAVAVWTLAAGEYIPLGTAIRSSTNWCAYVTASGSGQTDSSTNHVGSTKTGFALRINGYNGTAGDYVFAMKGGASGITATYDISVTTANGYSVSATVEQADMSDWTPAQITLLKLKDLPAGIFYVDFTIKSSTGSNAGNYGYFTIDTLDDGVITMPTTAVVDFAKSAASTSATVQNDTTEVGSTKNGSTLSFIISAEATAQYGFSYEYGSRDNAATVTWALYDTVGNNIANLEGSDTIEDTDAWTLTKTITRDIGTLSKGIYILVGTIASSGTAGNYGQFQFTKTAVTTYTIAVPEVENATAVVTVAGVELEKEDGSYVVVQGATAVVTYTANDGYYFADGQKTTFTFSSITANVEESAYESKLPTVSANPTVTIPVRENATRFVYVNGTAVDNDTATFSVQPGSTVTVSYAGSASGTPYGLFDFDLGTISSASTSLSESDVPLYFKDETVTTKLTGDVDVVLYASYNTSLTLDCDWSELTGTVYVYGAAGYVKFGENYSGSADADWVVNDQLDLTSLTEKTIKFKSLSYSSMQRIFLKNGAQSVTFEIGGDEDFTCAANVGFGSDHWSREPNENASVTVKKVGTGKMTTNLAGARVWIVSEGEVAFVPLTGEDTNDTRYLYVTNCNTMTVKSGATVSGFYGSTEDSGLAAGKLSALVLESGSTFSPTVGKTWNVKTLSLNGATIAPTAPDTGLVNGKTYTLITATEGITGTFTSSGDFTVMLSGNSLVATYTGTGAYRVANGETLTLATSNGEIETKTAANMTTEKGIVIEEGGKLVIDLSAGIPSFEQGTYSLPEITLPDGYTYEDCVTIKYPSGYRAIDMVATDGYGWQTLDAIGYNVEYVDSTGTLVTATDGTVAVDSTGEAHIYSGAEVTSLTMQPGATVCVDDDATVSATTVNIVTTSGTVDATSYYTSASLSPVNGVISPVLDESVVKPEFASTSEETTLSADEVSLGVSNVKAGLYYGLQNSDEASSGFSNDVDSFKQATSNGQSLSLTSETDLTDKTVQFFKIVVSDVAP